MNTRAVAHLISFMLMVIALAMLGCAGVAVLSGDPPAAVRALVISAGLVFGVGAALSRGTRGPLELSRRDGFGIVAFGWVAAAVAGALPYLLAGVIRQPVAALFESMSGLTTTGASVLTDLEALPRGILFWRALTHFFGGMGVLIMCVAILPFLGVGGMQIYRAEMPGPSKDRLAPRITTTAKLLWGVYVALIAAQTGLLMLGGLSLFDALCHAFATLATGGFSTRTASLGAFNSVYIEVVTILFMFLAGVNFSLHYRALSGQVRAYFRDPEFRFYCGIWLVSGLVLSASVWRTVYPGWGQALRSGFFQGTSILTTTGFATADFDAWPAASRLLLVLLMFIGGCAGSTGGGIKHLRLLVVIKMVLGEIMLFMRPQAVVRVKVGGRVLPPGAAANIGAFFTLFLLLFALNTLLMTFYTPDLATAASSVIAAMGNIGPGLAAVGPTQTYAAIPDPGQLILTFCMLLGRLEIYTVLIVLLPGFWKK
ncbi:MAG: TrkH family potassium uptake protein [Candidatus Marinimicrobia bacterium]|nr:TrkH family potassium uptake protein [Candidatus Neomarinimicrobiota bacterium]